MPIQRKIHRLRRSKPYSIESSINQDLGTLKITELADLKLMLEVSQLLLRLGEHGHLKSGLDFQATVDMQLMLNNSIISCIKRLMNRSKPISQNQSI